MYGTRVAPAYFLVFSWKLYVSCDVFSAGSYTCLVMSFQLEAIRVLWCLFSWKLYVSCDVFSAGSYTCLVMSLPLQYTVYIIQPSLPSLTPCLGGALPVFTSDISIFTNHKYPAIRTPLYKCDGTRYINLPPWWRCHPSQPDSSGPIYRSKRWRCDWGMHWGVINHPLPAPPKDILELYKPSPTHPIQWYWTLRIKQYIRATVNTTTVPTLKKKMRILILVYYE